MSVAFLIDECIHRRLVDVAREFEYEAEHVVALGLAGAPDPVVAGVAVGKAAALVTNNRRNFRRIYARVRSHPGVVLVVPNGVLALQAKLFGIVLRYLENHPVRDHLVEIAKNETVTPQLWRAQDA